MPRRKELDARLEIRLPHEKKQEAMALAEAHDMVLAEVLRAYLDEFIATAAGRFVNAQNQMS